MAEKVTTMVLTVDLQCCSCIKKIKKVLAKFPEIRSHIYDEKKNTVTITVVCCSPENFRGKLCCKAGKTIKCIEIKKPVNGTETKPPSTGTQDKPPSTGTQDKPPSTGTQDKPPSTGTQGTQDKPPSTGTQDKPPSTGTQDKPPSTGRIPDPALPPCVSVHVYPNPVLVGCGPCCVGNPGGPCFHGCGRPVPCCDGYGYGYGCGCNRRCYVSRCDEYFISEGNTSGCAIV